MATLANLQTYLARDLRDTGNDVFSTDELTDLINQGTDALADFYPKQIVQTLGTVSAGTHTYDASSFTNIYRLDVYSSANSYLSQAPQGTGDGRLSGWEMHGGVLYMPPVDVYEAGSTLQAWGYGRYIVLSASSDTTDVDASGIWAVRVFAQVEGFARLLADRTTFQQWQAVTGNTDVTLNALANLHLQSQRRWLTQQQRLRRIRKRS